MLTIATYSLDLPTYACARLRLLGPASALRGRVEMRWAAVSDGRDYAIDASAMDGADLVVFQRYFPMRETWPLVESALASGVPVVYEVDDNFLAVPEGHPMRVRLAAVEPYARRLLERADLVTVSTTELKRAFAGLAAKVEVLPNFLDERLWGHASGFGVRAGLADGPARDCPEDAPGEGPVRIVFAGTPSHLSDLAAVLPALAAVKARYGSGVELTFMGCAPEGLAALCLPFNEDYAGYAAALAALDAHIGIAPLADNAFNRCKSAVKWLEYSALGMAGVYADLPPYARVRHGETGFKAGGDPAAWEKALTALIGDPALRRDMGARARAEALGRCGLEAGAKGFFAVWQRTAHARS
ncbi:glycosyl transferase family 1 [Fundidesulfovibrio terrae]|uniref:glycosyl transferase family 1 n=1 Tax=Fundidesulfovibrio terrae TaxID=2922866 RepID=UPI001FB0077A|nr:glycosyl transferase family 1 [Fundidesulfovibrio terrae]